MKKTKRMMFLALAMLCFTTSDAETSEIQTGNAPSNVEAVDLGLPSGILWANMNIGANKPSDHGLYFAWGETTGYKESNPQNRKFNEYSYKWFDSSSETIIKYCKDDYLGNVDNKTTLELEDDAAHVNWGGDWVMPTIVEIEELFDNTTHEWTQMNGINGYKFVSKTNGNSIFLPATGCFWGGVKVSEQNKIFKGYYWSASLQNPKATYKNNSLGGQDLEFVDDAQNTRKSQKRWYGFAIRPIIRK